MSFQVTAQSVNEIDQEKITAIDSYIREVMDKKKIPGLVYGVFDENSILLTKPYGLADLQNQAPVREHTVFELASITKQFTASAILILQQDGKLNINDPLHKHFPECPESWNQITIKHLLTHTSGLTGSDDYPGINDMTGERVRKEYANWSKQFLIDALIKHEPQHPPGEVFHYSDPGYALLGLVIDNITGSYREFMEDRIFKPLEMSSTYLVDQRAVHPFEARGYTLKDGKHINIRRYHNIEIPSWFGVFSNIPDLQKWDAALNSNLILDEKSKELLWQNFTLNNGEPTGYGLGWFHVALGGYNFVQHGGITGTDWIKFPDRNFSIVLLTNLGFNGADQVEMRGITNGIAQILGYNVAINSKYITNSGLKVIPIENKLEQRIIGDFKLTADWGNGTGRIYKSDDRFFLALMGFTFEIGLLENGSLIQFGLPFEYILIPNEDYSQLIFQDGSELKKQN